MTIARMQPSGKRLYPAPPLGLKSWDAASTVTFELLPSGHPPGLYFFTIASFVLVAATSGNVTISATFSAPGFGPTTAVFANAGNINAGFIAPRHIMSSGATPLTLTFAPGAIVGSPRLSLNVPIEFIQATLPEDYP